MNAVAGSGPVARSGRSSPRRSGSARSAHRGTTVLEVTVAGVVLALVMSVTVQLLAWTAFERRSADERTCAAQEAANVLERLTARDWADITAEGLAGLELSEEARRSLPGAELRVEVADDGEPETRRVTVSVRWGAKPGVPQPTVRLTGWVYREHASVRPS